MHAGGGLQVEERSAQYPTPSVKGHTRKPQVHSQRHVLAGGGLQVEERSTQYPTPSVKGHTRKPQVHSQRHMHAGGGLQVEERSAQYPKTLPRRGTPASRRSTASGTCTPAAACRSKSAAPNTLQPYLEGAHP